jgi:hypothetical protein
MRTESEHLSVRVRRAAGRMTHSCIGPSERFAQSKPGNGLRSVITMDIVRCPYCVSGYEFRAMAPVRVGKYVCAHCGHFAMPDDGNFTCNCKKCKQLYSVSPQG